MKYVYIKVIFIALIAVFVISCSDSEVVDFGDTPRVMGFTTDETTKNFLQGAGGESQYDLPIKIEYRGAKNVAMNEAVTVTFAVVDSITTATLDNEYSIKSNKIVIPAGKEFIDVLSNIKINTDNLDASDPKVLSLVITKSSKTNISETNVISITLQAICKSTLAGNYKYLGGNEKEVTIEEKEPGLYKVSGDNYFTTDYYYYFSDVCNTIKVTKGRLNVYGLAVKGTGLVNADGTITITYYVDAYIDNEVMILKKI